ncbi:MAG: chromosome segregation SMC family protein [Patescibacteria group bacterium]|nr:chromosome segregation SMC family protein [Patescibacteria group bacterium]MDD5294491.1 chromosome segregation SMC family protein [Patescibacteria group bacterium]MDD5554333.1 chromosome segregation SMC family protein [Patescibacteria group bacterium]
MFLEKLEIQGFKSFANKNKLVFPGMITRDRRGITAVVGPNGSGKSNIADAVRWALGEQSMKTLRGKKSEDIIFSGSDRKGRLGMAEVSLFLNNEDRKAPIDYSEVILTRRLFRDGESEYLINQSRVRLSDVQMMLAKAKFGQKTYSVIGQGMVEGFLNTSLTERKEFFDEATGVKQFQIKRDDSLGKLQTSYENLNQVNMLLSEIEPRLKSLTRQVNRLEKREKIEAELRELQLNYYRKIWHEINDKFNEFNNQFLDLEKTKLAKEKKLEQLNHDLEKIRVKDKRSPEFEGWQKSLGRLQGEKEEIVKQIARLDAQLEIKLEARGQFDLSWLNNKREELAGEIKKVKEEIESLENNIRYNKDGFAGLEAEKREIDKLLAAANDNLIKLSSGSSGGAKAKIKEVLEKLLGRLEEADKEKEEGKLRELLRKIKGEFRRVVEDFSREETEGLEEAQKEVIKLTRAREEAAVKINENNLRALAWTERVKLLREKLQGWQKEAGAIEDKLRQNQAEFGQKEIDKEKVDLKKELEKIETEAGEINKKIDGLNKEEEKEKDRLFSLQKEIHNLQNEVNDLSRKLNDLKINSTRQETRLEDLEAEIRENLGNLKEVREKKFSGAIDMEEAKEKMGQLKHQLELIGGIDPETTKEYKETKERFDFLSGQIKDLVSAIKSLEKIIEELDATIKERFDKEFKIISGKFEEYFKILFNGGVAKIIKVMEEEKDEDEKGGGEGEENSEINPKEEAEKDTGMDLKKIKFLRKHNATGLAGIEIQATPPGKKIKTVAMLSGGERALTAIALICAIISANPSPFVVLDEVDAALDESNSERLAKILDDLSHKTQFIVITHNRASMRRANILYGVTMGDDGVSKLLSIKLEEAGENKIIK